MSLVLIQQSNGSYKMAFHFFGEFKQFNSNQSSTFQVKNEINTQILFVSRKSIFLPEL